MNLGLPIGDESPTNIGLMNPFSLKKLTSLLLSSCIVCSTRNTVVVAYKSAASQMPKAKSIF